jgi:hypothetical protein
MASCISAGLVALDEVRRPAVAAQQLFQFLAGDAGEDGRVGNLVAVEMQDRQHRAVGGRIEKLVGMPAVASGPVSASPSPTTQATMRSGLSNTAPNEWLSE